MSRIQNLTLSDTSEKTIPCDWLLCSSDFRDIILIPCDLDEVDIDDQCTFEQPTRSQIRNAYFSKSRYDDTAEKIRRPLTWMMFVPCRRGIPCIQRTVFSSITHRANHAGPPLLHKNPMSDPQRSAGDLVTVAPKPWGATSNPPSLDCKPDKNGIIHHSLNSSGTYHHKIKIKYGICKKIDTHRESTHLQAVVQPTVPH